MTNFTVTGSNENGSPVFMHAVANDHVELQKVLLRDYLGDAGLVILLGHCESASGEKPRLATVKDDKLVVLSPEDAESAHAVAYTVTARKHRCFHCDAELVHIKNGNHAYGDILECPNHNGFPSKEAAAEYDPNVQDWTQLKCDSAENTPSGRYHADSEGILYPGYPS